MLSARFVIDLTAERRILRGLQKILSEIDSVVEKKVVSLADVDIDLAGELWSEPGPIALEDVGEIVILTPVLRHGTIDLAGQLVPDRFGITVASDRRIDRLPNVPLAARATVRSEREFHVVHVFDRGREFAEIVSLAGTRHSFPL